MSTIILRFCVCISSNYCGYRDCQARSSRNKHIVLGLFLVPDHTFKVEFGGSDFPDSAKHLIDGHISLKTMVE